MSSDVLTSEILVLCIRERMSMIKLSWVIDMSDYPNVEKEIDNVRKYAKCICEGSERVNNFSRFAKKYKKLALTSLHC